MKASLTVSVSEELLLAVFEGARGLHPRETILLLRGKRTKDVIRVSELVVPPLATYGRGFAGIRAHMLPMDFSIVGTVHSHPSGSLKPSVADLNHFFGVMLMIVGFPYEGEGNVAVYDHNGERLAFQMAEP
jgi:proteasome lid subunit RPN8/RPN11